MVRITLSHPSAWSPWGQDVCFPSQHLSSTPTSWEDYLWFSVTHWNASFLGNSLLTSSSTYPHPCPRLLSDDRQGNKRGEVVIILPRVRGNSIHRAPLHLNWQISTRGNLPNTGTDRAGCRWGRVPNTVGWWQRHIPKAAPAVADCSASCCRAKCFLALQRAGGPFMGPDAKPPFPLFPHSPMSPVLGVLLPACTTVLIDV